MSINDYLKKNNPILSSSDEHEDMDFTEIRKGRKRSNKDPQQQQQQKKSQKTNAPVSNQYNCLESQLNLNANTKQNPAASPTTTSANTTKEVAPPPIFIESMTPEMKTRLMNQTPASATFRIVGLKMKINCPSMAVYKTVICILNDLNLQYYTFTPECDKPRVVVMRGISHDTDISSINTELQTKLKDKFVRVLPMTKRARLTTPTLYQPAKREPFNGFFVHLKKGVNISEVKLAAPSICRYDVIWELPNKTKDVLQCRRCQRFGHGASNCHLMYRCVKCTTDHQPGQCPKKSNELPACVNCDEKHTANYRGCEEKTRYVKSASAVNKRYSTKSFRQGDNNLGSFRPPLNSHKPREFRQLNPSQSQSQNNTPTLFYNPSMTFAEITASQLSAKPNPPQPTPAPLPTPPVDSTLPSITKQGSTPFLEFLESVNDEFGCSLTDLLDRLTVINERLRQTRDPRQRKMLMIEFLCQNSFN